MPKITITGTGGSISMTVGDRGVPFALAGIQGLTPADATINMTGVALNDGARFDSSKVGIRTINIAIAITAQAPQNRQKLYKVFVPGKKVKLEYVSEDLDVWTEGYVSSAPVPLMDNKQIMTAEILCMDPYLRSAQTIIDRMNSIINAFHFPFAITADDPIPLGYQQGLTNTVVTNNGAAATGFIIRLHVSTNGVRNPKIFNYITGEFFGVNYNLQVGDTVEINTTAGNKTVTLTRDAVETNIFNYIMQGSTWLQLEQGENVFTYELGGGDPEDLTVEFEHYDTYTGV